MWVLVGLDDGVFETDAKGNGIGGAELDVVVVNVSGTDVAVMGGNGVDSSGVGDLGVRVEGCHDGGVVETVAVDNNCMSVHCCCFVFGVADLVGRAVHGW